MFNKFLEQEREKAKQHAIIVDIDGCMLDDREILQYIPAQPDDREGWNEFHKHLWKCKPIQYMFDLINGYPGQIIFVTAREHLQHVRHATNISLDGVNRKYLLHMRPENDYRTSNEVKKDIYEKYIKNNYIIDFAIDDAKNNIDMWQSLGINTLKHEFGKKQNG